MSNTKLKVLGGRGLIQFFTKQEVANELVFVKDNIYNWYPLDGRYKVNYNKSRERVYIAPCTVTIKEKPSYGIDNATDRAISHHASTTTKVMYIKEVATQNRGILKLANDLGLHSVLGTITANEIANNYKLLGEQLDGLNSIVVDRYMKSLKLRELGWFGSLTKDSQLHRAYAQCTEGEDNMYRAIGELYTFLSIKRKLFLEG
jgi:hypothetical protein